MIYLLGGYLYNDNFGDIVLTNVWVDWYKKKKIDFIYLAHPAAKERCAKRLGLSKAAVLSLAEFCQIGKFPPNSTLHLYGGGYLNKFWHKTYLPVLSHAAKSNLAIIATGLQLDRVAAKKVKAAPIKFFSVRDSQTANLLHLKNIPLVDDAIGRLYLKTKRK